MLTDRIEHKPSLPPPSPLGARAHRECKQPNSLTPTWSSSSFLSQLEQQLSPFLSRSPRAARDPDGNAPLDRHITLIILYYIILHYIDTILYILNLPPRAARNPDGDAPLDRHILSCYAKYYGISRPIID